MSDHDKKAKGGCCKKDFANCCKGKCHTDKDGAPPSPAKPTDTEEAPNNGGGCCSSKKKCGDGCHP